MSTHTMTLEVILPNTSTSVQNLLYALAAHLKKDAERYKKVHKVDGSCPATEDKTDAAELIKSCADLIRKRSKARWVRSRQKAESS